MRFIRLFAICAFSLLALPALAGVKEVCLNADYDKGAEEQRAACKEIIDSPASSSRDRAAAYVKIAESYDLELESAIEARESAIEALDRAIELEPKQAEYYIARAVRYVKLEKEFEAEEDFDQAIKLEPKNPAHYSSRLTHYLFQRTDRYSEALQDAERLVALKAPGAQGVRGVAYTFLGETEKAIADLSQQIKDDLKAKKTDPILLGVRGQNYLNKKEYMLAIADFSKALGGINHEVLHNLRGQAFTGLKQYDFAIEEHTKAIQLAPEKLDGYYLRAQAHELNGDGKKAAADRTLAAFLSSGLKQAPKKKSGK